MLRDAHALDREYSPNSVARDAAGSLRDYRRRSDAARSALEVHEDVRYAERASERCHVFPAATRGQAQTPALVFVHGGHWQESGIDDACFAAEHAVAHGCAFVAVGYGLAPDRTLPEMIASVARALDWLAVAGPGYGIDPQALHVAGSSAGAHLLAAVLAGGAAPRVRSACLLSGLYDLAEIPETYVNDALGLTAELARACSPSSMPAPACDTVLLAAGEHETRTYLRQQEAYAAQLHAAGAAVTSHVVADRDHFELPLDLADPASAFGRTSLSHLGLAPHATNHDTSEGAVSSTS